MSVSTLRTVAVAAAASIGLLSGCSADTGAASSSGVTYGTAGTSSGGTSGSAPAAAGGHPMLVDVDPNRTMTAAPGEGVGVFTEYASGGHWHVWWTCDTNVTAATCDFVVTASVAAGAMSNVSGKLLDAQDQLTQPSAGQVEVVTQTSTGIDGVSFDAAPGAIVTLDAQLNGQDDSRILFFVQDGLVNGDYKGSLTDPLMFEPSSP